MKYYIKTATAFVKNARTILTPLMPLALIAPFVQATKPGQKNRSIIKKHI